MIFHCKFLHEFFLSYICFKFLRKLMLAWRGTLTSSSGIFFFHIGYSQTWTEWDIYLISIFPQKDSFCRRDTEFYDNRKKWRYSVLEPLFIVIINWINILLLKAVRIEKTDDRLLDLYESHWNLFNLLLFDVLRYLLFLKRHRVKSQWKSSNFESELG